MESIRGRRKNPCWIQHKRESAPLSSLYGSAPGAYWNLTNPKLLNAWIEFSAKEYVLGTLTKTMGTWRDEKNVSVFAMLNLEASFPLE